ncbi:MAG: hypothetical protein ACREUR_01915 [Nitrosospira sp.]
MLLIALGTLATHSSMLGAGAFSLQKWRVYGQRCDSPLCFGQFDHSQPHVFFASDPHYL